VQRAAQSLSRCAAFETASCRFEGALRHAVHRFKYEDKTALAAPLAVLLHDFLLQSSTQERHIPTRVFAQLCLCRCIHGGATGRGYNQSELLARELSRCLLCR
jgi:predicted amidophosphoribosyltransferase